MEKAVLTRWLHRTKRRFGIRPSNRRRCLCFSYDFGVFFIVYALRGCRLTGTKIRSCPLRGKRHHDFLDLPWLFSDPIRIRKTFRANVNTAVSECASDGERAKRIGRSATSGAGVTGRRTKPWRADCRLDRGVGRSDNPQHLISTALKFIRNPFNGHLSTGFPKTFNQWHYKGRWLGIVRKQWENAYFLGHSTHSFNGPPMKFQ